jgi:glycosyltransferase involved in cell wall biosynthesis
MDRNEPEISIVTPMHNEQECLPEFYRRTRAVLEGMGTSYEIVMVDDGSMDATGEMIADLCARDAAVVGVSLSRNRGQCIAIYAGFQESRGRYVIVMDADLQHLPEDIPRLLGEVRKGFDFVKAVRQNRQDSFFLRRLPSMIANYLIRKTSRCEVSDMGGFACMRGDLARSLRLRAGQHRLLPALVFIMGASVAEVPVSAPARFAGKSHYGLSRSLDVFLDIIMLWFQSSGKQRPLYLFGRISLVTFAIATLLLGWTLFEKVVFGIAMGARPPFFLSILLYLGSLGILSTALLLEVLSTAHDAATAARPYVLRRILRRLPARAGHATAEQRECNE